MNRRRVPAFWRSLPDDHGGHLLQHRDDGLPEVLDVPGDASRELTRRLQRDPALQVLGRQGLHHPGKQLSHRHHPPRRATGRLPEGAAMRLTEMPRLFSPTRWANFGVVLLVIVITTPEARAVSECSQARTGAAKDAVGIVVERGAREDTIDSNVMEAERELRQAPEGERNRIALRRLCLSDAARSDPACRSMRQPRP